MKTKQPFLLFVLSTLLSACGGGSGGQSETTPPPSNGGSNGGQQTEDISSAEVALNQLGFLPLEAKTVLVPDVTASRFQVVVKDSGDAVLEGDLNASAQWPVAQSKTFKLADVSQISEEGTYVLQIEGVEDLEFEVKESVYDNLHDAALKAYYFNRASQTISETYGGVWARAAGHADTVVQIHDSAGAQGSNGEGTLSSPKGWYDAGDYGKYVVNSGIATYTLLAAYDHHSDFYQIRDGDIPESGNGVPDILDEIKWNLDWLETMQADDGSVYHKLTTLGWPGLEMPEQDTRARYVIGKSTSAALDFAAVMAMASRIYGVQSDTFASQSDKWLEQAQNAWLWAQANDNFAYIQPQDVESGQYGDGYFQDEFSWAAAELYLATKDPVYLEAFQTYLPSFGTPSWQYVSALGVISLLSAGEAEVGEPLYSNLRQVLLTAADDYLAQHNQSTIKVAMVESDFVWGSNSVVLNKAMVLMQAYKLTDAPAYKEAAMGLLSYILGQNPTGYSFVTGFGSNAALYPHHRVSASDGVDAPIPGMLVGGPQNGQQDGCSYPSNEPALSYLDDWCSYSTNEVAINWNAPLVYVLASFLANEN